MVRWCGDEAMVTVAPKYAVLPLMASAVQTQQATDALRLLVREVTTIMQNTGHLKFHFIYSLDEASWMT